jgi:hypothetical protein
MKTKRALKNDKEHPNALCFFINNMICVSRLLNDMNKTNSAKNKRAQRGDHGGAFFIYSILSPCALR